MFAPRGYTAIPQDVIDEEEDEDQLAASYEQEQTSTASTNLEGMGRTPSADNVDGEKERRIKRNHVRFESKSLDEKQEPMSQTRRLCFVVSLMICTLTIFVFAFTVPCKRASCNVTNLSPTSATIKEKIHGNWSMSFPGLFSQAGITFHHALHENNAEIIVSYNMDKTGDNVIQKWENVEDFQKGGLLSLNEENGALVWLYNASNVKKMIRCQTQQELNTESCLIENFDGELQLVNPRHNEVIWSTPVLIASRLPSIIASIADCDGDGEEDILLSYNRFNVVRSDSSNQSTRTFPGQIQVISGNTGRAVGGMLTVSQTHLIKRISLHSTSRSTNILFVLTVGMQGHLKVIPIRELYKKVLKAKHGFTGNLFENDTSSLSRLVSLKHAPVVKDLNQDFVEDIVLVTLAGNRHSLTAVDGGKMNKIWRITFGSRNILSSPVIGHFNNDNIPDILVVLQDPVLAMLNQSLIQILDGRNGKILWSRKISIAEGTSPVSASIGHNRDAFFIWIVKEKVQQYQKMFTLDKSKRNYLPKEGSLRTMHPESPTAGEIKKRPTNKTTSLHLRHRRDEQPSHGSETPETMKSSIRAMEEELDSLAEEAGEELSEPITRTELPTSKAVGSGKALELLKSVGTSEESTPRGNTANPVLETDTNTAGKPTGMHPPTHITSNFVDSSTGKHTLQKFPLVNTLSSTGKKDAKIQAEGRDKETKIKKTREEIQEQQKDINDNILPKTIRPTPANNMTGISEKVHSNHSISVSHSSFETKTEHSESKVVNNIAGNLSGWRSEKPNTIKYPGSSSIPPSPEPSNKRDMKNDGTFNNSSHGNDTTVLLHNGDLKVKIGAMKNAAALTKKISNAPASRPNSFKRAGGEDRVKGAVVEWKTNLTTGFHNVTYKNQPSNTNTSAKLTSSTKNGGRRDNMISNNRSNDGLKQNASGKTSLDLDIHPIRKQYNNEDVLLNQTKSQKNDSFAEKQQRPLNNSSSKSAGEFSTANKTDRDSQKMNETHDSVGLNTSSSELAVSTSDDKLIGGCHMSHGLALVAIFPNSPRNSFSVISQEDSYGSENPCEMYWPLVTSNPVVLESDKDGYMEIFYVVNYINTEKHETTMKVKKFDLKVNQKP